MSDIISSTPAMLLLVVGSYYIGTLLYRTFRSAWVHPVAIGMLLTLVVLLVLGIDYPTFKAGTAFLDFLLGPTVVALGYLLYEQIAHLRGREVVIFIATAVVYYRYGKLGSQRGKDGRQKVCRGYQINIFCALGNQTFYHLP